MESLIIQVPKTHSPKQRLPSIPADGDKTAWRRPSRRPETENHPSALGTRVNHSGRLRLSAKFTATSYKPRRACSKCKRLRTTGAACSNSLRPNICRGSHRYDIRPILNSRSSRGSEPRQTVLGIDRLKSSPIDWCVRKVCSRSVKSRNLQQQLLTEVVLRVYHVNWRNNETNAERMFKVCPKHG